MVPREVNIGTRSSAARLLNGTEVQSLRHLKELVEAVSAGEPPSASTPEVLVLDASKCWASEAQLFRTPHPHRASVDLR